MTNEWTGSLIIDEIDRLSVAYSKAKEYLTKVTSGIEQQMEIWQYRQQVIRDQLNQMKPSSSYDFLLPKTQRINELTLEAVQALCRVDLLIEQILRIDLKSRMIPTSNHSLDTNIRQPTTNGPPMPIIRTQPQASSGRSSTLITHEKIAFAPVKRDPIENTSRPSSIIPLMNNHYSGSDTRPTVGTRVPQFDHVNSNYQTRLPQPRNKEKIKLQRIPPGTKWKSAKIDIIDTLSGFYVGNLDQKVHENFLRMQDELHDYYDDLQKFSQLIPLENISIGDFGVAKYSEDNRWYRARLIMREGHEQIKIVFVDFGNIEIKSIKDFFPLDKSFTELPAQAVACSLSEAFPRIHPQENEPIWPEEAIEIFKQQVADKIVEIHFVNEEEGTDQWPLHFVRVIVDNQVVTNSPTLQRHIDPRPNYYIAEQMAQFLSEREYILFNVPISDDDLDQ